VRTYLSAGCALVTLAASIALPAAAFAEVSPDINGLNVRYVKCGASEQGGEVEYSESDKEVWTYLDQNGHSGTADEVQHDEWSVYLHDDQDAEVVLDMYKKTCTWSKDDNVRSYTVLEAGDTAE